MTAQEFAFRLYKALEEDDSWGVISNYDLLTPDAHECDGKHLLYAGECSVCYDHTTLLKAIDKALSKVV